MTHADTTTTAEHRGHDAEALQTACELVWALRCTHATTATAAEYREQAAVLARVLNTAATITQGGGASAYEYAAELITEAAESYTDTGNARADAAELDRVIYHTAERALNNAAHEARERDEREALRAAGYR